MTSEQARFGESAHEELASRDIPKSRDRAAVYRFASTVNGYRHFEEAWGDALARLRKRWVLEHALPWDLGDLRAWLALEVTAERFVVFDDIWTITRTDGTVHVPDPDRVTSARMRHEVKKAAIVDRIRAVVVCRERSVPTPTTQRAIRTLIPRTLMLERYLLLKPPARRRALDLSRGTEAARLAIAENDEAKPAMLIAHFKESVARFRHYSNVDEPFHPCRAPPMPGPNLWETDDISGRLLAVGTLPLDAVITSTTQRANLGVAYVGREIFAARTAATKPTHRMQGVELVRHDLLLRSLDGDLPVIGEVKTPTDKDAYYALIQLLAAASQLVTSNQMCRLRQQEPTAGFVDASADPRVDLALVFVDPDRCGRSVQPTKTPQKFRTDLDAIACRVAKLILGRDGIGDYVRRIFRVDLGLNDGRLVGKVKWAHETTL